MKQTSVSYGVKKSAHVIMARREEGAEFSILDRKVFHVLLANAYSFLLVRRIHQISLRDLSRLASEGGESEARIIDSLQRLWRQKIAIDYVDDNGAESMIRCNYLSFELSKVDGAILSYSFDEILLKFLHEPEIYSFVKFDVTRSIRRKEALKLYEVMQMKYRTLSPKMTVTVDEIRSYFEVEDLYNDKADNFRFDHFRSRCFEPAVREVNAAAEFTIECEYIRSGRGGKVQAIEMRAVGKPTAASGAPRIGKKARDDDETIDMFGGVSDKDRNVPPPLSDRTLEEATDILGVTGSVEDAIERWFKSSRDKETCFTSPDEMFLAFLRVESTARNSRELADIDIELLYDAIIDPESN